MGGVASGVSLRHWMMGFERCVICSCTLSYVLYFVYITLYVQCRFNKHIKNLCRHPDHPEAHLSNSVRHDVSARFVKLLQQDLYDPTKDDHHRCVLSVPYRGFVLTSKHMGGSAYSLS